MSEQNKTIESEGKNNQNAADIKPNDQDIFDVLALNQSNDQSTTKSGSYQIKHQIMGQDNHHSKIEQKIDKKESSENEDVTTISEIFRQISSEMISEDSEILQSQSSCSENQKSAQVFIQNKDFKDISKKKTLKEIQKDFQCFNLGSSRAHLKQKRRPKIFKKELIKCFRGELRNINKPVAIIHFNWIKRKMGGFYIEQNQLLSALDQKLYTKNWLSLDQFEMIYRLEELQEIWDDFFFKSRALYRQILETNINQSTKKHYIKAIKSFELAYINKEFRGFNLSQKN